MLLDSEDVYALFMFRALSPENQERAMLLLAELQQKTTQTTEHSLKEGETE